MSEFEKIDDNSFASVAPTFTVNSPSKKKKINSRLRSLVWNDFVRKKIGKDDYTATCNICKKDLAGKSTGGTSHLKTHAIRCKRNQRKESGEISAPVFSQVESRKNLVSMIILHEYPLSIVEHVGFRKFVGGLQSDFKMVSRNTIKTDIIKIYDVEKEKTCRLLESVGRVAITTDIWSAKPTKKGFMAITAHFIDNQWRLQNRLLTFVYVAIPHNKEALSDVFIESLDIWNIDFKISTITVDNATTNDAMISMILRALPRSSLLLDGKLLHVRCAAHILNLIVKEGLTVAGGRVDNIRSCLFWTWTQSRIEKFEAAAAQLNIPYTKGLENDVKTRWNSTYHMIRTALMYKEVFAKAKQKDRSYDCLPSDEDWAMAEDLCERLKIFDDVTVLFSGTTYPSVNLFFVKMCELKLELNKWLSSSNKIVREMASKMVDKCDKYWKECHLVMSIACVLDPRYKMKLVEYQFGHMYRDRSSVEVEKVRKSFYDLFSEYQLKFYAVHNDVTSSSGTINLDNEDTLDNFDVFVNESTMGSESELDMYLRDKLVPRKGKFNILNWCE